MTSRDIGLRGEKIAEDILKKSGYKIVVKNFRSKFGEIDIVALDQDTLVFVEVKMRSGRKYGLPEEAVDYFKLAKIRKSAEYFVATNKNLPEKQRIEVVAIEINDGGITSSKIIKVD